MRRRSATFIAVALVSVGLVSTAAADDWPCWRGPNYDGISPEKGFRTSWDTPPAKLWQRELGSAFSGLSCVGGKVYTCGTSDKKQVLFCLNADTGDLIWQTPIEAEYRERQGGDGDVDLSDLAELLAGYGACEGDPDYNRDADLDWDGCVDLSDLATLLSNYSSG